MRHRAVLLSALLAFSLVGGVAAPAAGQQANGESYAGTHVEFRTTGSSVADYAVGGDVLVENVSVQSASEARNQAGVGLDAGLESTTDFRGTGLQLASSASASATVEVESGAEMQAHDNSRGILQVRASDGAQVVTADLGNGSEASAEGDNGKRVVVSNDDGSQGTFIVVGDGEVVVDQHGDVTAEVAQGGQLVYRQYQEERSDSDAQAERMIENGTATAEVYVQAGQNESESAAEDGQNTTVQTIKYGQDTTVEVAERSRNRLNMTVERSQSQGKVVLATLSDAAFDNAQDVQVTVDGQAATQADSYGAVEQSAQEGDEPRYYVEQSSSAEATTDVAIGIDHFSARNVVLSSADGSQQTDDGSNDDGSGDTDADGAGFGVLGAIAALAAALIAARRP